MNYLPADDADILQDITSRKEFYQYTASEPRSLNAVKKYDIRDTDEVDLNLESQSYQKFVANFLNPYTPYARLILKWVPGSGKTIAALNIAMQFIKQFERESQMEDQHIGSVFVVGFTEELFKQELLKFPAFGFINRQEITQWQQLKEAAHMENKTDMERLQEFTTKLKKRLGSRKENGYFKFFGYKAFVNRIFNLRDFKRNINELSEEDIKQSLKDGSLQWDKPLLDSFKNSLVICDEIHNVYNSLEKNNWGIALQMVLDHDNTTKAVFMSATLLNNNPTEVVDLGNLVMPPHSKLNKEDFFEGKILKKHALQRIAEVFRGKLSFIQDTDPRNFATQTMMGVAIRGIPYLKFQRCPMSEYHYATYKKVYTGVLAQDAQYLMDIAFPNPQGEVGLYRTNDIKRALSFADDAWYKKYGFKVQNDIIVGPGLDESRIGTYSSKMHALLLDIKSDLTPYGGKILVYHDVVHISGVLFIEQLLLQNGFIGIDQSDTEHTLCVKCGVVKSLHKKIGGNKWQVVAADARVKNSTPCGTKMVLVDDMVVAYIHVYDEDAMARIDMHVEPAYLDQGIEEYLLEHYTPDKPLVVVLPDQQDATLYIALHFRKYDQADGNTYYSWQPRVNYSHHNMPHPQCGITSDEYAALRTPALVYLSDHVERQLVPRYESQFTGTTRPGDRTTLLVRDGVVRAWVTLELVEEYWNVAEQHFDSEIHDNYARYSEALQRMLYLAVGAEPVRCFDTAHRQLQHAPRHVLSLPIAGGAAPDHEYMPARYIMAHSDMEKSTMYKNIERFNSADNMWGYNCKIIVGSKIIKESYNFYQITKLKVTARPANIATLIQIMGRARRKAAHLRLPPEHRNIEVKIFTSCLPTREKNEYVKSHEEMKYGEKIQDYLIIQNIERSMHENAIDAVSARAIILPSLSRDNSQLGALWFEPAQPAKKYNLKNLNLSTFEVFHSDDEIRVQIYIIKRLFVETSLCFTLDELWASVQMPPFHVEQNTTLFQHDYFVIALSMLVYGVATDGYVRPTTTSMSNSMLDILHSAIDKRIMQGDGTLGYIHHLKNYYVYVPFRDGRHEIYTESVFRTFDLQVGRPINIQRYLKDSSLTLNYENQKLKFRYKFENVPLEKLSTIIGTYGVAFHQLFIEEIIKYVFTMWVNPGVTAKSEMHDFYFKLLYYYDVMNLVVWAATAKDFIRELYKPYMLPVSVSDNTTSTLQSSQIHCTSALKLSTELLDSRRQKKKSVVVVRADPKLLPIGHFMGPTPRFYHPDREWFESPEYSQRAQEFVENDIVIGYYEKSGTGLRVKFKIRTPIHKLQLHKDIRMVEKGSICSSNSKEYLMDVATRLKIKLPDKYNVPMLSQEIENRLQLNELQERKNKTNVKWFYSFWETQILPGRKQISVSSSPPR